MALEQNRHSSVSVIAIGGVDQQQQQQQRFGGSHNVVEENKKKKNDVEDEVKSSATGIPISMAAVDQPPPALPCCGVGLGWFLFILGFFFALPWFFGAGSLLRKKHDRRERPGYIACAIFAVIFLILLIIRATRPGGFE